MDKNLKLLMIDDDEDDFIIFRDLARAMKNYTVEIEWADTMEQALSLLDEKSYNVLLADYNVGNFTALDLLKYVHKKGLTTPVIVLTGIDSEEADIASMRAGAIDFLIKDQIRTRTFERSLRYAIEHKANETRLLNTQQDLRLALKQLKKKQVELVQMKNLQSIKKLAGAIAHEFSQPLQALHLKLELIQTKHDSKHVRESLELLERLNTLQMKMRNITILQDKNYLDDAILDLEASTKKKKNGKTSKDAMKDINILVLDDEHYIVETLTEMLQLKGYNCDGVENGDDALEMLQKKNYDVIISDINMPQMSGPEFFKKVKKRKVSSKFVFMTGYELTEEVRATTEEADALLIKPVTMTQFSTLFKKLQNPGKA